MDTEWTQEKVKTGEIGINKEKKKLSKMGLCLDRWRVCEIRALRDKYA